MNVLLVTASCPFPVRRGRDRLIENLIAGLTPRNHVTLVTMTLGAEEERAVAALANPRLTVRTMRAPHKRSLFHRALQKGINGSRLLGALMPMQVSYARPAAFVAHAKEVAADMRPDVVFAIYWHLFDLPLHIKSFPVALITCDVDFLVHAERIRRGGMRFGAPIARIEAELSARIEKRAYATYDTVIALTGEDARAIARASGKKDEDIMTLPLALDLDFFKPPETDRERNTVLLSGALDADFNRDALRFFTEEVFPLLRAARPEVRCEVVGHGLSASLERQLPAGMAYLGGVDDVRPTLGRCACMVLPLRFGGGVRIRMLEAAAMGTPVVSTPLGVAGMGLVRNEAYLEASSARDMADAVLRLLADAELRRRVGGAARRWAVANIWMEDYPARLDELLARVATRRSKSLR